MKKYKLIKNYPDSGFEVGDVAVCNGEYFRNENKKFWKEGDLGKFSENWVEVKEIEFNLFGFKGYNLKIDKLSAFLDIENNRKPVLTFFSNDSFDTSVKNYTKQKENTEKWIELNRAKFSIH